MGYNASMVLRRILAEAGTKAKWCDNTTIHGSFDLRMPPEFFIRGHQRLKHRFSSPACFGNWVFSREMNDLVDRGHVQRVWKGPRKKANSPYVARLTAAGKARIAQVDRIHAKNYGQRTSGGTRRSV